MTPAMMRATGQHIAERREVERAKDELISLVSHELRTPLTSIRGSLGLLASGALGPLPDQGQRLVQIAVQNTDRLMRLVNDLLDIERIAAGAINMRQQSCDAAQLIQHAVQCVEQFAADAHVTLSTAAEPTALWGEPDRVVQTLTNLIANAVTFSPPGSTVRVSCARSDDDVLFEVADDGRGIPADKLASIFERFEQVDASDSRENGGSGLGLAICRTIVERHGGRIWVTSELAAGSVFSFTLPAMAAPNEAEHAGGDRYAAEHRQHDISHTPTPSAARRQTRRAPRRANGSVARLPRVRGLQPRAALRAPTTWAVWVKARRAALHHFSVGSLRGVVCPGRLRERLPAQPHSVPLMRRAIDGFAARGGASDDQLSAIALAVSEAVSNAVIHAYVDRDSGDVAVDAELCGQMLHVTVRDQGIGMRPRLDSPGLGLGLSLIARLSDHFELTEMSPGVRVHMAFALDSH